ncbi:unnamed protein product [Urochloa humidicola]
MALRLAAASLQRRVRPALATAAASSWRYLSGGNPQEELVARKITDMIKTHNPKAVEAARYFYTLPTSCPASKTSSPTTGMPSLITHRTKPPCVGSVRVKPTFTSSSSTDEEADFEPDSACKAEIEAFKRFVAWKAELDELTSSFDSLVTSMAIVWTLAVTYWVVRVYLWSSRGGKGKSSQSAENDNAADPKCAMTVCDQ